jgi:hypothetical protein
MKAFILDRYGNDDQVRAGVIPDPEVRENDAVLHSLDDEALKKPLRVLKPGGKFILISGPPDPDPDFAKEVGSPWTLRPVMRVLS